MVLLTPSAISVAISSSVVCTFTFLLFLSGYVLQQQTVRSLQEAIRRPPDLKPDLPIAFQPSIQDTIIFSEPALNAIPGEASSKEDFLTAWKDAQRGVGNDPSMQDPLYTDPIIQAALSKPRPKVDTVPPERLAYVLAISKPSQICSALLFFKWQHIFGTESASRVLLYPSNWEYDNSVEEHADAVALMRVAEDEFNIIYHPVDISTVWAGIGVETQLLAELQRYRWNYDRILYLQSPGFALDIGALDTALRSSSLSKSWMPIRDDSAELPSVLLLSSAKGMLVPRGEMRKLTAKAMTRHSDHHESEMDVEAASRTAAYVLFNENELDHRRSEKEWYGSVFERFERGRAEVCKGTIFEGVDIDMHKPRRKTG